MFSCRADIPLTLNLSHTRLSAGCKKGVPVTWLVWLSSWRSLLIKTPSTFQSFFTFILLPGSAALLQVPECSEYHLSEQSPGVSANSLTSFQLSGTGSWFLSISWFKKPHLTWNLFLFKSLFFVSMALICDACLCVCVCVCCMHCILKKCTFKECVNA